MMLEHVLVLSAYLFSIGIYGLIDRLSLRKSRNRINLNSGPLFEILVKHWICYLMSAFCEKRPMEGAGSTIQSNEIEHVSHLFSRNKWAISLQNCAQFHVWQFRQDRSDINPLIPTN